MNNAFQNSSSSVVISKYSGELEDFRAAPLTSHQMIWALAMGAVVRGGVVAVITYFVGASFYWYQKGTWLAVEHPFEFLFFVLIGGFVFGLLGLAVAIWAKNFDQMSAFSAFLLMPLTYLGGVFVSIQNLHPFWQRASEFNPVLYFINGLRHSILGVSDVSVERSILVSLLAAMLFYALGLYSLKKGSFHRW